jgi:glutamine synthetase
MEPIGEIRVVPDLGTYRRLPYVPRVARVLCDQLGHDGQDWGCCGRSYLKSAVAAAADLGITVKAAFEDEFYLATGTPEDPQPFGNGPCYSTAGLDRAADVLIDIVDALTAQHVVVEQVLNEYGPGQQEISVRYTDALAAADQQVIVRDTIRAVAEVRHGLMASFAPKPYPDKIGSGAHIHFSLWDADGTNLIAHPNDPFDIGGVGASFVAGILEHLPALVALTCPSFQSYDRLSPAAWAGSTVSWGFDNREATLRVSSPFAGREAESANAELKASDSSANPYLALGGLMYSGLDGVRRGLTLPEPARSDPAKMTPAELASCGVRPLPATQVAALDALAADTLLTGSLGDLLARCIQATRRAEAQTAAELGRAAANAAIFTVF